MFKFKKLVISGVTAFFVSRSLSLAPPALAFLVLSRVSCPGNQSSFSPDHLALLYSGVVARVTLRFSGLLSFSILRADSHGILRRVAPAQNLPVGLALVTCKGSQFF